MRIAVFDLDGTLSRRDLYLAFLMTVLRRRGPARPLRAATLPLLTARYMLRGIGNDRLKAAYLDAILGGRERGLLDGFAADFAADAVARQMKPAALERLAHHRTAGDVLLLASASLDLYVAPIARLLGFDGAVATRVAWTPDGRVTGALDGPNLRGSAKLEAVREWIAARFPAAATIIAYSDHESDEPLLAAAEEAFAVDPTPALAQIALRRGWPVMRWSQRLANGPGTPANAVPVERNA